MKVSEKPLAALYLESMSDSSSLILWIYSLGYVNGYLLFYWDFCLKNIGIYKNDKKISQVKWKNMINM